MCSTGEYEPLVTIGIISYNSHLYLREALESAKSQTYNNIELVVSDDCSTDDSIQIARDWIKQNESRFANTVLLTSDHNTGVSGNCQRALEVSHGEWCIFIAYDDILHPNAISSYLQFISRSKDTQIVQGRTANFSHSIEDSHYFKFPFQNVYFRDSITAKEQFNIQSKVFVGSGPGFFFNPNVLRQVGGFDLRFPLQEDHALFIKLAKAGFKMYLNNELTIFKRDVPTSIIHERDNDAIFGRNAVRQIIEYKGAYQTENMNSFWKRVFSVSLAMRTKVITSGNKRSSFKCMAFYWIQRIFDPMRWYLLTLKVRDVYYGCQQHISSK